MVDQELHDKWPIAFQPGQVISFRYKNWRGEVSTRSATVTALTFGATEWHPEPQWLVEGTDNATGAQRSFAIRDMVPVSVK